MFYAYILVQSRWAGPSKKLAPLQRCLVMQKRVDLHIPSIDPARVLKCRLNPFTVSY